MNKHDELLKKIEELPQSEPLYYPHPEIGGFKNADLDTDELQSLAADFQLLADEYEKLREMLTEAEHVGFKRFYIDRPCWGEDKESWYIFDFETDVRVSEKAFGSAIEAYSYLEAKQSGEEGE